MKTLNVEFNKIPFLVRIVEQRDSYGLDNCLIHDKKEPLVEFYDARYNHTPFGQFVSRYGMDTIVQSKSGLNLNFGIPYWQIDKDGMDKVRDWLKAPAKKLKLG